MLFTFEEAEYPIMHSFLYQLQTASKRIQLFFQLLQTFSLSKIFKVDLRFVNFKLYVAYMFHTVLRVKAV